MNVLVVVGVIAAVLVFGGAGWAIWLRHRPPRPGAPWRSAADRAAAEETVTTMLPVTRLRPAELNETERERRPLPPSVGSLPTPSGVTPRQYRRPGGVFGRDGQVGYPEPSRGQVLPLPGVFADSPTARVSAVPPRRQAPPSPSADPT